MYSGSFTTRVNVRHYFPVWSLCHIMTTRGVNISLSLVELTEVSSYHSLEFEVSLLLINDSDSLNIGPPKPTEVYILTDTTPFFLIYTGQQCSPTLFLATYLRGPLSPKSTTTVSPDRLLPYITESCFTQVTVT